MDHAAHSSATAEPACHTRELDPSTRLDNAYPATGATTRGTWTPRGHCSISSIFLGALNRRRKIAPPDMTTGNPHSHLWKHRVTWGPGLNFRRGDILNASLRWSRNNINLPGGKSHHKPDLQFLAATLRPGPHSAQRQGRSLILKYSRQLDLIN